MIARETRFLSVKDRIGMYFAIEEALN